MLWAHEGLEIPVQKYKISYIIYHNCEKNDDSNKYNVVKTEVAEDS